MGLTPSALSRFIMGIALIGLMISATPIRSHEATGDSVATANDSVNSAFSSVYYAEQNGGDVSGLVAKLNTAILLIQNALAENATNPNAAATNFSNSTTITQQVSMASSLISNSGAAARQLRLYESLGNAVATIGIATLTYLKGDRVYRRLWYYVYKNYLVKSENE